MTAAAMFWRCCFLNCERIFYVIDNPCQIYQVIDSRKDIDSVEINWSTGAKKNYSGMKNRAEKANFGASTCVQIAEQ
jgi:hypothetical protein